MTLLTRPAALLLLALASCGGPPPPAVLALTLTSGPDQNPDAAGTPNSVAIHVYQLTDSGKFDRADVFALLDKAPETLGAELAATETVFLPPGGNVPVNEPLKPNVRLLGLVAAYRDIDHATWRLTAPVKPSGTTALTVHSSGIVLSLEADKK